MDYIHINKLHREAIYLQIANSIRKAIHTGRLHHYDHLPTEEEMCSRFNISNIVVKQAYQRLVAENLVIRIRGKGTYVHSISQIQLDMASFDDFEKHLELQDIKRHINLIEETELSPKEMVYLGIQEVLDSIRIVIVGTKDITPIYMQIWSLPTHIYKNFDFNHFQGQSDIIGFLKNTFKLDKIMATHEFGVESLNSGNARMLGIPDGTACYSIHSIYKDREQNLAYVQTIFPGSLLRINFTLGKKS